jgi:hypothetical protein
MDADQLPKHCMFSNTSKTMDVVECKNVIEEMEKIWALNISVLRTLPKTS